MICVADSGMSGEALRNFFEVDRRYITTTALYALSAQGKFPRNKVAEAYNRYGIDCDRTAPFKV